jgi:hypothetical protein
MQVLPDKAPPGRRVGPPGKIPPGGQRSAHSSLTLQRAVGKLSGKELEIAEMSKKNSAAMFGGVRRWK